MASFNVSILFETPPKMNVHCRIGSLESKENASTETVQVHCRIGSLEIKIYLRTKLKCVHCRIGSLEIELE